MKFFEKLFGGDEEKYTLKLTEDEFAALNSAFVLACGIIPSTLKSVPGYADKGTVARAQSIVAYRKDALDDVAEKLTVLLRQKKKDGW